MQHDNDTTVSSEDQHSHQSIEDFTGGNNENVNKKSGIVYHTIGIITIIFGIMIGIYLLVQFTQSAQTLFSSDTELTLGEFAIALGASLLFIVPGVLCIGIAQIIELLGKEKTIMLPKENADVTKEDQHTHTSIEDFTSNNN